MLEIKNKSILVINAGSSSIKFSVFVVHEAKLALLYHGEIDSVLHSPIFEVFDAHKVQVHNATLSSSDHQGALNELLTWVNDTLAADGGKLIGIGHRIVHGGKKYSTPVLIDKGILEDLETLKPLAPIHEPYNLLAIEKFASLSPKLPQVACFDTGFHTTQEKIAQATGLPQEYEHRGIIKYGFHGLSYEYITTILPEYIGNKASGKIVVMHLGNGSSMCAINNKKSVASTMGFSTIDGLMMGTRTGRLDPGIVLYLLQEEKMKVDDVVNLLYKKSGLIGVSGISNDVRELLNSDKESAQYALELYCYKASYELGGLMSTLNGADTLVFTGGIGENAHLIRYNICKKFEWLGLQIDEQANKNNQTIISTIASSIDVLVIPTNEEKMIAQHTVDILRARGLG
ncbi:acetate/propionate family kinase [Rickettsiales endosymbiont of Peranema trichophorum]|uniref:acetate/propionate family kinase n=1 Tax=Rickettsiales endosymbiont of Peranema trichophorum TaxID=2486577 RepID=UPI001022AC69|nr:acetate/propionate family kinase [Rickettsiales endosymbiont of Peranema trichophorum]RZI47250.1 acetate/propionate family kinase [Rickettsiales endosymbiont of Peranema trichophorum]